MQVAVSQDGSLLGSANADKTAKLWDVSNGTEVATIQCDEYVTSISFARNGERLAVGCGDGSILLWNLLNRIEERRIETSTDLFRSRVWSLAFSPDSQVLAAAVTGAISIWDATTGNRLRILSSGDKWSTEVTRVAGLAFSSDGRILASAGGEKLILWDVNDGKEVCNFPVSMSPLRAAAFLPGSMSIITAQQDGTIKTWAVPNR
jgi:WD40 repeat protein